MISVTLFKNRHDEICGFMCRNHGESYVCAGVSMLTNNLVNSVETFCESKFSFEYEKAGGYMEFVLSKKHNIDEKTLLLLNSFELGMLNIKKSYPHEINLVYKNL